MKRLAFNRLTPFVLSFFILFSACFLQVSANAAFLDVASDAWYFDDVDAMQVCGIMDGVGKERFAPDGSLTLAQAIALAAKTHAYENGSEVPLSSGEVWYNDYLNYAAANGLCAEGEFGTDYQKFCNRLTMATLFARVFPQDTEKALNDIAELPDMKRSPAAEDIYYLYEQGVLTGGDPYGSFQPYQRITRAEAAVILHRIVDPSVRKSVSLTPASAFWSSEKGKLLTQLEGFYEDVRSFHGDLFAASVNSGVNLSFDRATITLGPSSDIKVTGRGSAEITCNDSLGRSVLLDYYPVNYTSCIDVYINGQFYVRYDKYDGFGADEDTGILKLCGNYEDANNFGNTIEICYDAPGEACDAEKPMERGNLFVRAYKDNEPFLTGGMGNGNWLWAEFCSADADSHHTLRCEYFPAAESSCGVDTVEAYIDNQFWTTLVRVK